MLINIAPDDSLIYILVLIFIFNITSIVNVFNLNLKKLRESLNQLLVDRNKTQELITELKWFFLSDET